MNENKKTEEVVKDSAYYHRLNNPYMYMTPQERIEEAENNIKKYERLIE